jgi:hypothetical protein
LTELEVYQPPKSEVVLASDIDSWTRVAGQVVKLAQEIHDTPFVPDGLRGSVPATAAAILSGRELGLGPMTSLANIHVIKGKPALSAALMRALILAQGHQIETVDISDTRAVVRGRRKGESTWEEAAFTADQAKRANIQLGGYPQDKLYARATSRLARRKFADVIAGMPYSAEELEDGADDDTPANGTAPAIEPPKPDKPRTAQRKPRTRDASPAHAAPDPAPAAPAPRPQGAGEAPQPPLPGEGEPDPTTPAAPAARPTGTRSSTASDADSPSAEPDDTDYDTPGTVTPQQLTKIWATLTGIFEFARDEKEQARAVCAHIAGRDLASSKELSHKEASAVLDTLAHWQAQAEAKDERPYDYLIAVMVAEEAAGDES